MQAELEGINASLEDFELDQDGPSVERDNSNISPGTDNDVAEHTSLEDKPQSMTRHPQQPQIAILAKATPTPPGEDDASLNLFSNPLFSAKRPL